MALEGTIIINNPFWWSSDDKFFNYSLGHKLGLQFPRPYCCPQKDYIEGIVSESLRNLEFPLDWKGHHRLRRSSGVFESRLMVAAGRTFRRSTHSRSSGLNTTRPARFA
jgi:hypothetical protein